MTGYFADLTLSASRNYGVPAVLLDAFIEVESGGQTLSWNPEPRYRYLWDVKRRAPFRALLEAEIASKVPPKDFPCLAGDRDQEFWAQCASWGLLQVMGAVARECGYEGPYLTALTVPGTGIAFGAQHLAKLVKRYRPMGWPAVISAYNAGSPRIAPGTGGAFENQVYVDKIMKALNGATLP